MAAFDLDEQEQLAELKVWWNRFGTPITALAMAAALASLGWVGWQSWQTRKSAEASGVYAQVEKAVTEQNPQKAREAAGRLLENYSSTIYADLGALQSAALQYQSGDLPNARAPLQWVAEKGNDPALREIARIRLSVVLTEEGKFEEALAQLKNPPANQKSRFEDARGNVLAAQGKLAEARAAWQSALSALDLAESGAATIRKNIETKLETVGHVG